MNPLIRKLLAPRHIEYLVLNRDFQILEISTHVKRFADSPQEIVVGNDVRLGFPELVGAEDSLLQVLQGQQPNFELKGIARFPAPNTPFYFDLCIVEHLNEATLENALVIFFEEVTEEMVLEQTLVQRTNEIGLLLSALSASKNYLDKVIASITDVLLVTTETGTIKTANRAAQELFGYQEDELINHPIANIFLDQQLLQYAGCHVSVQGQIFRDREVICQTKTNDQVTVAFSCSAVQTGHGDSLDLVYLGRDMTQRKRAAEEVIRSLERERELNELKSSFVSMVSHEFRTPLTTVQSAIELLEYYDLPTEEKLERFQQIRTAVRYMTQLLEDVLAISRTESEGGTFQPVFLNLVQFCDRLIRELCSVSDTENRVLFTTDYSCGTANMDAKLLRQILTNLLSNAMKYSPQDRPIYFNLKCQNQLAIFEIRDQGIGIPVADQQHVFEAFHRGKNVGAISGTGLGLAIVKRSVDLHHGNITFCSDTSTGTTFKVTLPLNVGNG
jgi:PAS domain S-box-containing protein